MIQIKTILFKFINISKRKIYLKNIIQNSNPKIKKIVHLGKINQTQKLFKKNSSFYLLILQLKKKKIIKNTFIKYINNINTLKIKKYIKFKKLNQIPKNKKL